LILHRWLREVIGSELGDRYFGRLDQRDDLAPYHQAQVLDRACGDDRRDDTGRCFDIDFGDDGAFDDGFDFALELIADVDGLNGHAELLKGLR